jgi:small subunit ribosomal protein S21
VPSGRYTFGPVIERDFVFERKDRRMVKIKARSSESVEQLLRRFKKACEKEGLTRAMKRQSYYEKPSVTRNRKKRQALKRKLQATYLQQL